MTDTVIENLITKLSFDYDDKELENFDDFLKGAVKGLTAIVAGATAAAGAIFAFTKKVAESNDALGKFAQRVGIDVVALQELGYVAELNGGSLDSMSGSMANLSRIASETSRGLGAGVEAFGILGVSVTDAEGKLKNADSLLYDVSDAISLLGSQAEKLEFAQKLGLNEDLLLMIQEGSDAIKKQRKEAQELGFTFGDDAAKAAAKFTNMMVKVEKVVLGVSNVVGTRLMKQITPMIETFVEWFKINKEIIQQNLILFLNNAMVVIKGVFNVVSRLVSMLLSLVSAMGGWKNAIIAVTGLLVALNATALLTPLIIVALGAAILLILEDIIKFAEGGESAIGNLAEKFPELDAYLRTTLDLLAKIRDGWLLIFTQGGDALEGFLMMLKDFPKNLKELLLMPLSKAGNFIKGLPGFEVAASLVRTATTRDQGGVGVAGGLGGGNTTNNNNTNNPNVTVNINGGDTEKVKRVIADALSDQYSAAESNLSSNVES